MPTPTPIAAIQDNNEFADKQLVMCVRGKIKALYASKEFEGNYGPYTIQNGELDDGTGVIRFSIFSNSQPMTARGRVITISCQKNAKDAWAGILINDRENTKTGEWTRELKVSETAVIEYEGVAPAQKPTGYQSKPQAGTKPTQNPTAGQATQSKPMTEQHPKAILEDLIAFHAVCHTIVNEKYNGAGVADLTPYVASIYIEGCRQGLCNDFKARYSRAIVKSYPPAPKDPTRWRECVMPAGTLAGKTLGEFKPEELKKAYDYFDSLKKSGDKKGESDLAHCVYEAAMETGLVQPPPPPEPDPLDPDIAGEGSDFPF